MSKLTRKEKGGVLLFAFLAVFFVAAQLNPALRPELGRTVGRGGDVNALAVLLMELISPLGVALLCLVIIWVIIRKARRRAATEPDQE